MTQEPDDPATTDPLQSLLESIRTRVDADMLKEVEAKLVAKQQPRRLQQYVDIQNELIAAGPSLVRADSYEAGYTRFLRVVHHAEGLWGDACGLFQRERFATALAMSITCVEEVGKIGVARFHLAIDQACRESGQPLPSASTTVSRRKNPFYSHMQKLVLAAGAVALVNARLDRILGMDRVVQFLDAVERGAIEPLRQACLYSDVQGPLLLLPEEHIDRSRAEFHVVLAGELLAEVGGFEADEFHRLLARVQEFERAIGHAAD